MEHQYSGGGGGSGSWNMIPSVATQSNPSTPSSQDHLYLQQHQHQFQHQQQQQRLLLQQQQQQQQQQQPQHQSLASHFHLFHLVEKLSDSIENGTRDQQSDALISDLNSHFEKCQQLLNSISGSIATKAMTVEGQKKKLEESEQLLNQRRELNTKYRNSVVDLLKSQP
ncbi:mediator of RNA polymerase II transcription subunit 9 [Argentina anserina]|uniref:mediator of RNA polymerase II transcription subunit 9 n=1 Tax=Argentina anserina TaxID=57926 RepID=UPI0021767FF3|nr:mediator of RNA polymerase II transcription subunit 9 [Potentilla anserina]XP_050382229.1 mediator of RNA polymerase II transcription subunit 9 [Potentilla anserina]